jgi:hypothetical protein
VARAALSRLSKRTSGSCRNFLSHIIIQSFLHNLALIEKCRLMPWSAYKRRKNFREWSIGLTSIAIDIAFDCPYITVALPMTSAENRGFTWKIYPLLPPTKIVQSLILLLSLLAVAWKSGLFFFWSRPLEGEKKTRIGVRFYGLHLWVSRVANIWKDT